MIIDSQYGKIQYQQSDYILQLFESMVRKPFDEHYQTEVWQRLVLDSYANKSFASIRDIVGRGQANFDEPFNGLTPDDRVLLYCYDNMQQHVVSKLYILEKHKNIFNKYLFDKKNIFFIDFGCGPLSSGIAVAMHYSESKLSNSQNLKFNYIGIDKATSMLRKAKNFSSYPGLFHSDSTFDFFNPYENCLHPFYQTLFSCMDSHIDKLSLIILKFSYFFASPSLNVSKLTNFIKRILEKYQFNQVCLIFQNPQGRSLNEKWNLFKNGVTDFTSVIKGEISDNIYYQDTLGGGNNERLTKVYYDIQFR